MGAPVCLVVRITVSAVRVLPFFRGRAVARRWFEVVRLNDSMTSRDVSEN